MQQYHEQTIHFGTKRYILKIRRKKEWWIWNITRSYEQSFLRIGTKQEQIPFWKLERAVLMFQMYLRVHHYRVATSTDIENQAQIFITFFNISSFTEHIQRFWTQITNFAVCPETFISQKYFFLPGHRGCNGWQIMLKALLILKNN